MLTGEADAQVDHPQGSLAICARLEHRHLVQGLQCNSWHWRTNDAARDRATYRSRPGPLVARRPTSCMLPIEAESSRCQERAVSPQQPARTVSTT